MKAHPCLVFFAENKLGRALSIKGIFDPKWYLGQNPDVSAAKVNPLRHYLEYGWREGRRPIPLFNPLWYLDQNPDVAASGREPLQHYLDRGWREGRRPHPLFDPRWYLDQNPDVAASGCEPLSHFLKHGAREGRRAGVRTTYDENKLFLTRQYSPFALSTAPLVSIIITNLNGSVHLPDLFASLHAQTYRNFEIVFVDDNSCDDSVSIAKTFGEVKIVRISTSVGFAKANNIGLKSSCGELVAILNNDTRVDPNWLESLVTELRKDNLIAVVSPKIRFWQKFQRIALISSYEFQIELNELILTLEYKKYFIRNGNVSGSVLDANLANDSYGIEFDIPIQETPIAIALHACIQQAISISVGSISQTIITKAAGTRLDFRFPETSKKEAFHIINNAGSVERAPLKPADRGFGEVDRGQYDVAEDVDLFCGCSGLIRRDALHGCVLFIDEFVAYYEDSELSKRLTGRGYRIRYCPNAIVYHKHSSTTVELSVFWRKHTTKNAILFDYIHSRDVDRKSRLIKGKRHINHLDKFYSGAKELTNSEKGFLSEISSIYDEIDRIAGLVDEGKIPRRNGMRIGLYNSFWRTLGGGEAHALNIASVISNFGQVELISETDFDLCHMECFFDAKVANVRKRIVLEMSSEVTADYDIFINSNYQSELVSFARHSYFVVSFPSRSPSEEFLRSYYFLANSHFTMSWMKRYWGGETFQGEVLYPSIPPAMLVSAADVAIKKEKIILSVGRFASLGHTKNQLEIAQAFRHFVQAAPRIAKGWKLVLIGSANDRNYIADVAASLSVSNAEIILDASFDTVRHFYQKAQIYIHASGFGRSQEDKPELLEHFGMAVAQAMGCGCVPIVFAAAGPREIVETAGVGYTYESVDELSKILAKVTPTLESRPKEIRRGIMEKAARFSRESQREQLWRLLRNDVPEAAFLDDLGFSPVPPPNSSRK